MLKRYMNDTSGNFAMIMALSTMVLLTAAGAAVDYSGMTKQASLMQDYADMAVLAAVVSRKTTEGEMEGIAVNTVKETNVGNIAITTDLTLKTDSVRVETSSVYKSVFMKFLGKGDFTISQVAEAPLGVSDPFNIALVLDTTASMSGARMTSMQTASKRLVDTMQDQDNEKIKISVVPFANYVNVGIPNGGEPWMAVPADEVIPGVETCRMTTPLLSKSGCTTETTTVNRPAYTTNNDGVLTDHPARSYERTIETCTDYEYGPEEEVCNTPPDKTIEWNGCVASREAGFHLIQEFNARPMPGIRKIKCTEPLLPLTNKYTSVTNTINSLSARGETYIPAGLVWGWRTLSPERPFTESKTTEKNTVNVMVIMTDGANTKSLDLAPNIDGTVSSLKHGNTDGDDANKVSKALCNKIKADNIEVYTVAYKFEGASGNKTKKMLQNCATSETHFFNAKNSAELNNAFDEIAANLFKVRLSL